MQPKTPFDQQNMSRADFVNYPNNGFLKNGMDIGDQSSIQNPSVQEEGEDDDYDLSRYDLPEDEDVHS